MRWQHGLMTIEADPSSGWEPDINAVRHFIEEDVDHRYDPLVPLERIDWETSKRTQVRANGVVISQDNVNRLIEAMESGAVLPALVATYRPKDDRYVLLGGVHRMKAALDVGIPTVDLHVVETDDTLKLYRLATLLNRDHGLPMSEEERVAQAVLAHLEQGMSQIEAAAFHQVKEHAVADMVTLMEADEYLVNKVGLSAPYVKTLSHYKRRGLFRLRHRELIRLVVDYIKKYLPIDAKMKQIFSTIHETETEAERLAYAQSLTNTVSAAENAEGGRRNKKGIKPSRTKAELSRDDIIARVRVIRETTVYLDRLITKARQGDRGSPLAVRNTLGLNDGNVLATLISDIEDGSRSLRELNEALTKLQ